ncbi:MAG: exodeoxyribonuclease VII small subunit [Coriobacteriia bacterium]|nr:exodeoxyribonuclease VII small subunit [Coriobacteriia bacterium]
MADYNDRLKEIQDTVENKKLSLDESLDLYEEAVKIGMEATSNMEQNIAKQFETQEDE